MQALKPGLDREEETKINEFVKDQISDKFLIKEKLLPNPENSKQKHMLI